MIYELADPKKAETLFAGWQETCIYSCVQGIMGKMYANDTEHPTAAMVWLGDFCFVAGEPDEELVLSRPWADRQNFMIMVPQNEAWSEIIESAYQKQAKRVERYAIKKEQGIFDEEQLQKAVESLPKEYTMRMMDEELFERCKGMDWCRDWGSQYPDFALYEKHGLGVVILKGDEMVSGASSYSGYLGGIEIEIDTKTEYRRQGLAYACAAKLILECLKRGWYPSWDAQNKWSVGLAEKLGYHYDHAYPAYEIYG